MRIPTAFVPSELRNRNAKSYISVGSADKNASTPNELDPNQKNKHIASSETTTLHFILAFVLFIVFGGLLVSIIAGVDIYSSISGYFVVVQPNILCQDYPLGAVSLQAFPASDWVVMEGQTLLKDDYPEFHQFYCKLSSECTADSFKLPNLTNTAIVPSGTMNSDFVLLDNAPTHAHDYTIQFSDESAQCDHEHTIETSQIQSAAWVHTHEVSATVRTTENGAHTHGFLTEEGRDYKEICDESTSDVYSCRSKRHTTWEGGHRHDYFKYDTTPVVKSSPYIFKNAESCGADAELTSTMQTLWGLVEFGMSLALNFGGDRAFLQAERFGNALDRVDFFLLATGSCEDCGVSKASGVCDRGEVTAHNGGYVDTDDVDTANCYPTPDVLNEPSGFSNVAASKQWLRTQAKRHDNRLRQLNATRTNSTFTQSMDNIISLMNGHHRELRKIASAFNGTYPPKVIPRAVYNAAQFDYVLEPAVHRAITTSTPRRRLSKGEGAFANEREYTCDSQYPEERNCAMLENFGGRFVESCKKFALASRPHGSGDDWAENCLDFSGYTRDCIAAAKGKTSVDKNPLKTLSGDPIVVGCVSNNACCKKHHSRDCYPGGAPTDAWGTPTLNRWESGDASNDGCTSEMCCKRWGKLKTCNEAFNHVCCEPCTHNAIELKAGITGTDCCLEYSMKNGDKCLEYKTKDVSCEGRFDCGSWKDSTACKEWNWRDGSTCRTWTYKTINCEGSFQCSTEEGCKEWNYVWGLRTTCKKFNTKRVKDYCLNYEQVKDSCKVFNTKSVTCEGRLDCGGMPAACKKFEQVKSKCTKWRQCEAPELCAEPDTCVFDHCDEPDTCFVRTGCNRNGRLSRRAEICGCEECYPYKGNEHLYAMDAVGSFYAQSVDTIVQTVDQYGTNFADCMSAEPEEESEEESEEQGELSPEDLTPDEAAGNVGQIGSQEGNVLSCAVGAAIELGNSMEAAGYGCRVGSAVISDMHVEEIDVGSIMTNHDLLTYLDEWMFAPHYGFDEAEERAWPKDSEPLENDGREYFATTRDGNTGCPLNRCVWEIDKDDGADEYSCRVITQHPESNEPIQLCHDQDDQRIHYSIGDGYNFECTAPNQPQMKKKIGETDQAQFIEHPQHDSLYPYCHTYGAPSAWDSIRVGHDAKLQEFNQNFGLNLKNEDFRTRHTHSCEGEIQTHPWYHKHDITGSCDPMQPSGAHTHTAEGKTDTWIAQQDCVHKHNGQVRVLSAEQHQQLPLDTTPPYVQHPHYIRIKGCSTY